MTVNFGYSGKRLVHTKAANLEPAQKPREKR